MTNFRDDLLNTIQTRADVEQDFLISAFVSEFSDRLAESEEIDHLIGLHFRGVGTRRKALAVDGYDLGDSDGSIALAVAAFDGGSDAPRLTATEITKYFGALQGFLQESIDGTFENDREASDPTVQLSLDLKLRAKGVTRYRLYLLTDSELGLLPQRPSSTIDGVTVDFHVWDVFRLEQVAQSTQGREELEISFAEWYGSGGLPALSVPRAGNLQTFLAAIPGQILADLYAKYGSRLLESNVRSYLSARGSVNKGIKSTVHKNPDKFLAFNNGITATATGITTTNSGQITHIRDLQIVNGGQTTASLFYVRRDPPRHDLGSVFVQMKLVVVDPEEARDLVPSISRFANSQNRVSEADFFSNSPFHQRMEILSRRILVPLQSGFQYQTKWFYERTRGQYQNERSKRTVADEKKFEATNPRSQLLTKTDAAKYAVSWDRMPHIVSRGTQKNFIAFAEAVSPEWIRDDLQFNETYFRELVSKGLLYESVRKAVANTDWYRAQRGYLANIVTYAVAKLSHTISLAHGQRQLDMAQIWDRQAVSSATLAASVEIGKLVLNVLVADNRPVQNVTEWAKRESCWEVVRAVPYTLPPALVDELADKHRVASQRSDSRAVQKMDNSIQAQTRALSVSKAEWLRLKQFGVSSRIVTPTDIGILNTAISPQGFPSERQSVRLISLLEKANELGFDGPTA